MTSGPVDAIDREQRRYLAAVRKAAGDEDRMIVMAAVVQALGRVTGWPLPTALGLAVLDVTMSEPAQEVAAIDLPEPSADAWLLGRVHEALLALDERHAAGAHYTPRAVAARLVGWATAGSQLPERALICDPAAGGGAFLLAAADALLAAGGDPSEIVRSSLWGIELDPVAVATTAAALSCWAWQAGAHHAAAVGSHLAQGDALLLGTSAWVGLETTPDFDLVIGNPPFQSQLGRTTARSPSEAAALRARFGGAVRGYADSATLFLLAASRMVRPGGRVALLQPTSVFGARDAARARSEMLGSARLNGVWTADARVFDAGVRVAAVVLEVDDSPANPSPASPAPPGHDDDEMRVRRAIGRDFEDLPPVVTSWSTLRTGASWSHLISAHGTPGIDRASTAGVLGQIASATAGFRDQYYGLIPYVQEADDGPAAVDGSAPLITSGLIDPARCLWGCMPSRFAKRTWSRPTLDVGSVRTADPRLGAWLDRVLVPKVLVACQTRVVEALVDERGVMVPSVPVIAVSADPNRLFDVAAALLAPFTSAWAVRRAAGAALGADAIKLAATQLLEVPLPADTAAWSEGAEHLRRSTGGLGDALAFAATMNRAYGLEAHDDLAPWWLARLPARTRRTSRVATGAASQRPPVPRNEDR
ncbi:MAG: N-6 DNA methylase [Actinomycetota bacterium]|nr:N-6 DNA methylase [Actinomycetota bacterium]